MLDERAVMLPNIMLDDFSELIVRLDLVALLMSEFKSPSSDVWRHQCKSEKRDIKFSIIGVHMVFTV